MNRIYVTAEQIEDIRCSRNEQETSINWMRDDEYAVICTSDRTIVTKISRAMEKNPDIYRCYYYETNRDEEGRLGNYFFELPKKLISFRSQKAPRPKRNLTDEQRKAIGERFRKKKDVIEI